MDTTVDTYQTIQKMDNAVIAICMMREFDLGGPFYEGTHYIPAKHIPPCVLSESKFKLQEGGPIGEAKFETSIDASLHSVNLKFGNEKLGLCWFIQALHEDPLNLLFRKDIQSVSDNKWAIPIIGQINITYYTSTMGQVPRVHREDTNTFVLA